MTGGVLFSPSTDDIQCYTPDGGPSESWRPTISDVLPHCADSDIDYYLLRGTQLTGLSQANIYGDDCYPATNYPLVQLRSGLTGEVSYCRTYAFSTMAVATGSLPQSARFDASNIPYGDYELRVIANGISSHEVSFCHRRAGTTCGCAASRSDCQCEQTCCPGPEASDPQIVRLRQELKALRADVQRLGSPDRGERPARQPKERGEATEAGQVAAQREPAAGKPRRGRSGDA